MSAVTRRILLSATSNLIPTGPQPRRKRQNPRPDRGAPWTFRRVRHHCRDHRKEEPEAQGTGVHRLRQCGQRAERDRRPPGIRPLRTADELGFREDKVRCYCEERRRRRRVGDTQAAQNCGEGYGQYTYN
jgi:hypothetical protein